MKETWLDFFSFSQQPKGRLQESKFVVGYRLNIIWSLLLPIFVSYLSMGSALPSPIESLVNLAHHVYLVHIANLSHLVLCINLVHLQVEQPPHKISPAWSHRLHKIMFLRRISSRFVHLVERQVTSAVVLPQACSCLCQQLLDTVLVIGHFFVWGVVGWGEGLLGGGKDSEWSFQEVS